MLQPCHKLPGCLSYVEGFRRQNLGGMLKRRSVPPAVTKVASTSVDGSRSAGSGRMMLGQLASDPRYSHPSLELGGTPIELLP